MKLLKIGISGVRGIVGESITPELVMNFACAFGTYVNSMPVLVGRDTRTSGPMLHSACLAALISTGCDVLDMGICPTPVLQYLVEKYKAGGGISISAGHNDAKWNALTFINQDGTYLNSFQGEEVLDVYHLGKFTKVSQDKLGKVRASDKGTNIYFESLKKFLDGQSIQKARLKTVIDSCNGAGAQFIDRLAEALGFELIAIHNEPTGIFPHEPEPRPRNAQQVASIIKVVEADVGFLLNSDVSRVSLVTENGESLSEEYTFPLIASYYLKKTPGPVVSNFSTSKMIESVARKNNCPLIKTRVGQSHSIQALIQEEAVLAGEGSGGIAIAQFQPAFDGFLTMGLICEMLAKTKKKISESIKVLPKYHIIKEKIYCSPSKVHSVVNEVRKLFEKQETDDSDGIRAEDKDGWIQVRTSTTEPMIRVISESKSRENAREKVEGVLNYINFLIK